jgi:hypothetical protein
MIEHVAAVFGIVLKPHEVKIFKDGDNSGGPNERSSLGLLVIPGY